MKIAFGGMTAEELFFGESGHRSGRRPRPPRRDIAAQMVGSFGWPARWCRSRRSRPVRSRRGSSGRCSPTTTRASSVDRLLDQAKAEVHMLLNDHRHLVIALRDELLEREELVGDEIIDVLHEAEKRHKIGLVAEA